MACFWVMDHKPPVMLTIDFDWKTGVAAKDWSKVAKKGHVDVSFSHSSDCVSVKRCLFFLLVYAKELRIDQFFLNIFIKRSVVF